MLGEESFVQREQVKIAAPPQTNGTSISCVRFLTNYDVGERKQHIFVTISSERKQIFQAAISKHETTIFHSNTLFIQCRKPTEIVLYESNFFTCGMNHNFLHAVPHHM